MALEMETHFVVDVKEVSPKDKNGYEVSVRGIVENGLLFVLFDNDYNKSYAKEFRKDMWNFYSDKNRQKLYQKNEENLQIGEICVAKMRIPSITGAVLTGPTAYDYHRVHVISINQETGTSDVGFVDDYKIVTLPIQDLFNITRAFIQIPSFMMRCQLEGMEAFEGTNMLQKVLKRYPPPDLVNSVMFVKKIGDDHFPIVNIGKRAESSKFNLRKHILEKAEGLSTECLADSE